MCGGRDWYVCIEYIFRGINKKIVSGMGIGFKIINVYDCFFFVFVW